MKTPVVYYGGKQYMLPRILPLIPAHRVYVEPFVGGGAVFFAKPPSSIEIINDKYDVLINFYRVAQTRMDELMAEIDLYLFSRSEYNKACDIVKGRIPANPIQKAAAYWYANQLAINHKISKGSLRICIDRHKDVRDFNNKKIERLGDVLYSRLRDVIIDNHDALWVITQYDSEDTFFYIDPPYYNSDMGNYKGYTRAEFEALCDLLQGIKGKFLLSHYPSDVVDGRGWKSVKIDMFLPTSTCMAARGYTIKKTKTECLTYNYTPHGEQLNLFEADA